MIELINNNINASSCVFSVIWIWIFFHFVSGLETDFCPVSCSQEMQKIRMIFYDADFSCP